VTNDPSVITVASLKISRKSTNKFEHQVVGNKTQGIHETLEHVSDMAGPVNDIEVRGVDGTQIIPNNTSSVSQSISYI
jgi:hypothetical protein